MAKKTKAAASAPKARGALTPIVRKTWIAHPRKEPKQIVEILKSQGIEVTSAYVSGIKFQMNKKKGRRKDSAPATPAAAALPKDAVSLGLLQKAKKLASQLGGIKEAKQALDALAQLMD